MVDALLPDALAGRRKSLRACLLSSGFTDIAKALDNLNDTALAKLMPTTDSVAENEENTKPDADIAECNFNGYKKILVKELGATANPDLALLTLVRLAHAAAGVSLRETENSMQHKCTPAAMLQYLFTDGLFAINSEQETDAYAHLHRLLLVIGYCSALGEFLIAHPSYISVLSLKSSLQNFSNNYNSDALIAAVSKALRVSGNPTKNAIATLRVTYYAQLLPIVADDLASPDPVAHVEAVGMQMSALVDQALAAGLLIAKKTVGADAECVRLAVIAMGKTGAQELNYISDVDVIYVVEPNTDTGKNLNDAEVLQKGTAIATELAGIVSASGNEAPLWPLDTALRPEGKDGALVRTLCSHLRYYKHWASAWEFQALLKARYCAGDAELGRAYERGIAPYIWNASLRENFVDDVRALRQRIETEYHPRASVDNRIKLGAGGLRDVEFTVQLLQLVHGRADASLRVRSTLKALAALAAGGYISRQDAKVLDVGYRNLRLLEHRCQLLRLQRTHELPTQDRTLRIIGRGIDPNRLNTPESVRELFAATRKQVRKVHEAVYYRPLLKAAASLTTAELTMTPSAARERLLAGGYRDPDAAMRHIAALSEGVSRRSAIQRQLLPVLIGWLSDGADPDFGLLSFRRLSEAVGRSHWYLAMLRDSPVAARRLCTVLAGTRWTTDRLIEIPEAIVWLADDAELQPRSFTVLQAEAQCLLWRHFRLLNADNFSHEVQQASHALGALYARELLRIALIDCLFGISPERDCKALSTVSDVLLNGVLTLATALVVAQRDGLAQLASVDAHGEWSAAQAQHALIALGSLGGREITYASDADVMFVYAPKPGADAAQARHEADAVARKVAHLLSQMQPHSIDIDTALRPEGKQGQLSRSLEAYREYYQHWCSPWERQALLRARYCAGDRRLGQQFIDLIAPVRWSAQGLTETELRQIRHLKARMEAERLPRGTDPFRHLKLGPGAVTDVEWAVQMLQLQHAGKVEILRTTSTIKALNAAVAQDLIEPVAADFLRESWLKAMTIRTANAIGAAESRDDRLDVLPSDPRKIRLVGRLIGLLPGAEHELENIYRRAARRARKVAQAIIFAVPYGSAEIMRAGNAEKMMRDNKCSKIMKKAAAETQKDQLIQSTSVGRKKTQARSKTKKYNTSPYPWL